VSSPADIKEATGTVNLMEFFFFFSVIKKPPAWVPGKEETCERSTLWVRPALSSVVPRKGQMWQEHNHRLQD
jgi:hypothetical protein